MRETYTLFRSVCLLKLKDKLGLNIIKQLKKFNDKPSPSSISMVYEKAMQYDMYSVYIMAVSGEKHLFESFDGISIQTLMWNEDEYVFNIKKTISPNNLSDTSFSGVYYYHGHALNFLSLSEIKGIKEFVFRVKSDIANYKFSREKYLFRKKKQEMKSTITILSALVEIYLDKNDDNGVSEYEILNRLFSELWFYHDDKEKLRKDTRFSLDALVESKDIVHSQKGYKPLGKAKNTIAEFYKSEERHHEIAMIQRKMLCAAVFSALAAIASAVAAMKIFFS